MPPKTRGGSNAGGSKILSPLRRSKRLKQSDIPAANTEADVSENQVEKSIRVNLSPIHDVSEHHVSEDPVCEDSVSDPDAVKDMEEDSQPLQPEKFFFSHEDYGKSCKLSTRCSIDKTMTALKKLNTSEQKWFTEHKQFKHIWHFGKHGINNNKVTGLWMLLLRAVSTQKKRVCWFVVNGVPIRYSMREHALITGLDCHEYDSDFNEENFGSYDFVERVFKSKTVTVSQVKKKFESMDGECNGDRLQVAVLYFLSTIIKGRRKFNSIYPFILKAVNNLKALETFPWGRLTFEDNMKEIDHAIDHFEGQVRADYLYPGFIIPLEVLAFECIPDLSKRFQESVRGANNGCPLICKRKFKNNGMTGFPLDQLNEALGTTKDIISILQPSGPEEEALLLDITERVEDEDYVDPIADAWNERLDVQQKKIFWEDIYKLDLASRENVTAYEGMEEPQQQNIPAAEHWMIKRMKALEDELKEVKMRLADVARYVNMPREEERTDFESGEARTGFESGEARTGFESGEARTGFESGEARTGFESGEARTGFENMAGNDVRMDMAHDGDMRTDGDNENETGGGVDGDADIGTSDGVDKDVEIGAGGGAEVQTCGGDGAEVQTCGGDEIGAGGGAEIRTGGGDEIGAGGNGEIGAGGNGEIGAGGNGEIGTDGGEEIGACCNVEIGTDGNDEIGAGGGVDKVGGGGDKAGGDKSVEHGKKQKFKTCARKKCGRTPKRKLKPSMHISEPFTQEKNKENKHNKKDDKKKEKK